MEIEQRQLAGHAAIIAAIAFLSVRFDSFPFPRTIIAAITAAAILYYSMAQACAEKLPSKEKETLSRKIIMPIFAAFVLFFFICLYSEKLDLPLSFAGTAIAIISVFFYAKSANAMGGFFSLDAEIKKGHKLLVSGPFAFVRHPLYLCALFIYLGLSMAANSIACAIILLFALLPWTLWRITIEEKMLYEEFGIKFLEYKNAVPMLIPKLF